MLDYLYDGTFEGLLTCVHHHYYTDKAGRVCTADSYQPSLLNGYMSVDTEPDKAMTVYDAINEKISSYALRSAYRAHLTTNPDKGTKILRFLVLGFRLGPQVSSLHGNSIVNEIDKLVKKVSVEQERMLQFVRFSLMEVPEAEQQVLYAKIEPDNDVLELVAHHFADRFKHDPFIIHDTSRNKAIIAQNGHWYISDAGDMNIPEVHGLTLSASESEYQNLWRTYFDHIAIKERINPRCQKHHMPVRYWKNLTEVNGI